MSLRDIFRPGALQRARELASFHRKRIAYRIKHRELPNKNYAALVDPLFYIECMHWMQLGKYHHYPPREIVFDELPRAERSEGLPSIGIVTPSYNQARYLEETVRSVLDQNYPSLSYAVVDGGSTDGSREIIEKYRSRLAHAVSEPDSGQSDAIVKGMKHVSGEILAYLNSDDILAPGALHAVGAFFRAHPEVDAVYGHRIIIDENSKEIGRWILPKHSDSFTRYFDYVPQETLFWRRKIYEEIGGIDPAFHYAMDWDLILRIQARGGRFVRLPLFLGCFRAHESQKSQAWIDTGRAEMERLLAREGSPALTSGEYHRMHWKYKRRAMCTTLAMSAGGRW